MSFLVLVNSDPGEQGPPLVKFSGDGELEIGLISVSGLLAEFSGDSTGEAVMTAYRHGPSLDGEGEGTLTAEGYRIVAPEMRLEILDDSLTQAPTSVTVVVFDAFPDVLVTFDVDGTTVATSTADSTGSVGPLSIAINETVGTAGVHTMSATQAGSQTATGTFTIDRAPSPTPAVIGPDAQPVDVPGAVTATGVRRWILQDLMPGGLGSYVLPRNPATMSSPHFERVLEAQHTTSLNGQFHVFEGIDEPVEWKITGYLDTQEAHDQLLAFYDLNRRFYVIDHRARGWKVAFINVDMTARKRQRLDNGQWNDWAHDYTISALVYDRRWWALA